MVVVGARRGVLARHVDMTLMAMNCTTRRGKKYGEQIQLVSVEFGSLDMRRRHVLTTVDTDVGIAQIIGDDQQDVRFCRGLALRLC
jgi:hypothetical protein